MYLKVHSLYLIQFDKISSDVQLTHLHTNATRSTLIAIIQPCNCAFHAYRYLRALVEHFSWFRAEWLVNTLYVCVCVYVG